GDGRDTAQHVLHCRYRAVEEVGVRKCQDDQERDGDEPKYRRYGALKAVEPVADIDSEVHLVRTWEHSTQGERAQKLLVVGPFLALDDDPTRPSRQTTAEARKADLVEGQRQLQQAGFRGWLSHA